MFQILTIMNSSSKEDIKIIFFFFVSQAPLDKMQRG